MTLPWLARNAFPKFVVQLTSSFKRLRTSGKATKALNTGIPGLLLCGRRQLVTFKIRMLLQPLIRLDDFQRISRGHQDLT